MRADKIATSRRKLDEITDMARRNQEFLHQLEASPEVALREACVSVMGDTEYLAAEIRRRAVLTDEAQAVRAQLDKIVDRARLDADYRERLEKDPQAVLTEGGLSLSDAAAVAKEMTHVVSPFRMCDFTCCRQAATDWSCDPSVIV